MGAAGALRLGCYSSTPHIVSVRGHNLSGTFTRVWLVVQSESKKERKREKERRKEDRKKERKKQTNKQTNKQRN